MGNLTVQDLDGARKLLIEGGPEPMYDFLASRGDRYAPLAKGVVGGGLSMSGTPALSYMNFVAKEVGINLSETDVAKIMWDMADLYLDEMVKRLDNGVVGDIDYKGALAVHNATFTKNFLPEHTWTLHPVFNVLDENGANAYWEKNFEFCR